MTASIFASKRRTASLIALALIALVGAIALSERSTSAQAPIQDYADASLQIYGDSAGDGLGGVAVGDFNADGTPDLLLGAQFVDEQQNEDSGQVYLPSGPIGPGAAPVGNVATKSIVGDAFRRAGFDVAAGDIDGDGIQDALWVEGSVGGRRTPINYVPGRVDFFDAATDLAREARQVHTRLGTIPNDIAVADLDGDGANDIVYGSPDLRLFDVELGSDEVVIYFGPFEAPRGGIAPVDRSAVIRGPANSLFGWSLAAGDLTGEGQADLAINYFDERSGEAFVTVLPGPFTAGKVDFEDLASQVTISSPLEISDLAIGDANLDGVNDLLAGLPGFSLVSLIPGQVIGPTCCADIFLLNERWFAGFADISFGVSVAVADYDGDGLSDVLIGSFGDSDSQRADTDGAGSAIGFAAADQGPQVNGVRPSIGEAGAGTEVEIWGYGFANPTVSFRAGGTEVEVETTPVSLGRIRATVPDSFEPGLVDVIVRTDIGDAILEDAFTVQPAPPQPPATRTVALARGWNLVGWTGATAAQDATATISGSFTTLYTWDAAQQSFQSLSSTGPEFLNTLTDLQTGDGVWINTPNGGSWEQPAYREPRSAPLAPGFNLAMWTGPDGTAVVDAVAGISGQLEVLFTWDGGQQRFLRYSTTGPDFLNDALVLNFGDGVWLQVSRSVSWAQPPSEVLELAPVDTGPEPATSFQEAESAIVLVDQGLGIGSGFVISETQILTNTHVVAGASSVTVRFFNGEERRRLVTARDQMLDVAVIEVSNLPDGVRRLDWESAETPAPGDGVWVWGFPLAFDVGAILDISSLNATLTTGIVSAIQTSGEGLSFVQTDAALERGNSGGPMITEDGRVIGISAFEVRFAEGQNFGINVTAHRDRIGALLAPVVLEPITPAPMVDEEPAPVHQFFGSTQTNSGALLDGVLAPDGSVVTAWNDQGEAVGSATIADGTWLIVVDSADAATVTFSIDGSSMSDPIEVASGALTEVTLDLASAALVGASAPPG